MKSKSLFISILASSLVVLSASDTAPEAIAQRAVLTPIWSSPDGLQLIAVPGREARPYCDQLAALDMAIFKEWPYLYEGTLEGEAQYLENYFKSEKSLFLLLMRGDAIVGSASFIPLEEEIDEIQSPFKVAGLPCNDYLYVGVVMILKEYRRPGLIRALYEHALEYAKSIGKRAGALAMIERPADDSRRPADDRPLDGMCQAFGFEKQDGLEVHVEWTDITTHMPAPVVMKIWTKKL